MLISEFAVGRPHNRYGGALEPQQDIVSASVCLTPQTSTFLLRLRHCKLFSSPPPRFRFNRLDRHRARCLHSEQCTNASKQVIIL